MKTKLSMTVLNVPFAKQVRLEELVMLAMYVLTSTFAKNANKQKVTLTSTP